MTNKQTFFVTFILAVILSLLLLAGIVKVDDQLVKSQQTVVDLQRQIDRIHHEDQELKNQISKLIRENQTLKKDLDVTQELQRKQAMAILELKKGKKR